MNTTPGFHRLHKAAAMYRLGEHESYGHAGGQQPRSLTLSTTCVSINLAIPYEVPGTETAVDELSMFVFIRYSITQVLALWLPVLDRCNIAVELVEKMMVRLIMPSSLVSELHRASRLGDNFIYRSRV